jgi:hypothetical protein
MLAVMSYPRGIDGGISDVEVKVLGTVGIQNGGKWCAPPTGLMRALLASRPKTTRIRNRPGAGRSHSPTT